MMDWYGFGGGGGGGGGGYRQVSQQFVAQYHVRSTGLAGRDVNDGDKVFLPPSALDKLARMNVEYPMLFEVTASSSRRSHCGVLEFSAEEGFCYMPFWMMENLLVEENQLITVKNVSLPKATFVKFQAQSVDFLEVTNPRALLEVALRKFTCLTEGDTIRIPHAGKYFYLKVRDIQPRPAASIIETDCNVDFDEPVGYKESAYAKYEKQEEKSVGSEFSTPEGSAKFRALQRARIESSESENNASFRAFAGSARRIDGKQAKAGAESKEEAPATPPATTSEAKPVVPSYQSRIGDKFSKKKTAVAAFSGTAHKLSG
eukprot:gene155-164_t